MLKKLDVYIVREHIAPFFISMSLIMFLFTLNLALRVLGRIVGQGLEPMVIFEFFFLNLAWIITLAVPMSMLVATLMGFGRLAGDREVIAMKSAGIGIWRMIRPVIVLGLLVAGFSLFFQDQILPDMNHRNKLLSSSIRRKKPVAVLREGIFTRDLPNQTLLVQEIDESNGGLTDVIIFDESDSKQPATVIAETGRLSYIDSLAMYQFDLADGEIHQMKRADRDAYEILRFKEARFRIDSPDQMLNRRDRGYRGDRELDLAGLRQRIDDLASRENAQRFERQINRYKVEYHKKFSISAAALIFVLLGAPLGIKLTQGGLGVSGPLAVLFFLLYWTFLIGGEDVADRGLVAPWLAMWTPNVVLGLLGLWMIRLETRQHSSLRLPWQRRRKRGEGAGRDTSQLAGWTNLSTEQIQQLAAAEREKRKQSSPDDAQSGPSTPDHGEEEQP